MCAIAPALVCASYNMIATHEPSPSVTSTPSPRSAAQSATLTIVSFSPHPLAPGHVAALETRRHFGERALRILRLPRPLQTQTIDIGCIDRDSREGVLAQRLSDEDRDRVRLFTGGAPGGPDAERRRPGAEGREMRPQRIPCFGVAEEFRDVDRERVEELLILPRILIEDFAVVLVCMDATGSHPNRDPAFEAFGLVRL